MIAQAVYLLCALTSLGCAILLFKGYRASRTRLLFSSALCFALMAAANTLLFVDLVIVPDMDLSILRTTITAIGHLVLLFGLITKPS